MEHPSHKTEPAEPWVFANTAGPLMIGLPLVVYYLWICVTWYGGALYVPLSWDDLVRFVSHVSWPTRTAVAIYGGWFLFQALLQIYAPGPWRQGTPLEDGSRLSYKMNGWFSWWATWGVLAAGVLLGWISPTLLQREFGPLLTTVNLFAFAFSLYLYFHGKRHPDGGSRRNKGRFVYDYFMGTSLNPRTGRFDWKLFCEARPGLIGWVAIDLSCAFQQYETRGAVTTPMILVCAFHFLYVADYYRHEEAILTTWDIKHENFGWMLAWGDLAWVPFTYTLQALYLLQHPVALAWPAVGAIVALDLAGYYLFRSANLQKHNFRKDPTRPIWGHQPEYIQTESGSRLLISGWWGVARHVNYLGDLMMGLAWCLTCGFDHLLPYFYIIYFTILLVHRERRDHHLCARRYGADWDRYVQRVRWRILPGIY
jgi:delta14-sterol reductase